LRGTGGHREFPLSGAMTVLPFCPRAQGGALTGAYSGRQKENTRAAQALTSRLAVGLIAGQLERGGPRRASPTDGVPQRRTIQRGFRVLS
jgi:hypothetical protein